MATYRTTKQIEEALAKIDAIEVRLDTFITQHEQAHLETHKQLIDTINAQREELVKLNETLQAEREARQRRYAQAIAQLESE